MEVPSAVASIALASSWRRGRIGVQATSLTAVGWTAGTAWWDGRRRGLDVR
jgi:hypothetical protein